MQDSAIHETPMPRDRITVAILEPHDETRHHVFALTAESPYLSTRVFRTVAPYFEVYGMAHGPDVLLVGLDAAPQEALIALQRIAALMPACGIIVFGGEASRIHLSDAMAAGAQRFMPYPCDAATVESTIRDVHTERAALNAEAPLFGPAVRPGWPRVVPAADGAGRGGKVLAAFSPKGGVGTTTLAVNLACALQAQGERVVLVDGNISFGTVGLFLNLEPGASMLQLLDEAQRVSAARLDAALVTHPRGLTVLLAPHRPEDGATLTAEHLDAILALLRARYDYVVVDTCPSYDERILTVLERADQIVTPTGPELSSIKNVTAFLRVARRLGWPEEKVVVVLMRADSVPASHVYGLEGALGRALPWRVVSDGKRATAAINNGEPFVWADRDAEMSRAIDRLAHWLLGTEIAPRIPEPPRQPLLKLGRFSLGAPV